MNNRIIYTFNGIPWQHASQGGWYFISLPEDLAKEIRENLKWQEEGWGRLPATARIGQTEWKTAIWFDTKMNTYLLPLKAVVREKEHIETGRSYEVVVWV